MLRSDAPGEFDLIAWIRERVGSTSGVALGIGDDCAGLDLAPGRQTLVTTDMLMDGRHFRLDRAGPAAVGYKALAVNLSDIAAMAGVPVAAFLAVALPKRSAVSIAHGLVEGMIPLLEKYGVTLAGGDTNAWDGPLVVSVTLVGHTTERGALRRSGAGPGDAILVTGPLGGSLMGRHLRPEPRVLEAQALAEVATIHAMVDLSDGLVSDLGHILSESGGLGALLDAQAIPIHDDAEKLSLQTGRRPLEHALADGEDFELCFTLDPLNAARLLADPPMSLSLRRVGTVDTGVGLRIKQPGGIVVPVDIRGYDHLAPRF
jgi:thiamine-monophosphate kinase